MRTARPVLAAAAIAALAAVAAPAPATTATTTHRVRLGEYFYRPKRLQIAVGERVRFTNAGRIEHTVADATAGGAIRAKVIRPRLLGHGKSQTVTFTRRGVVHYVCTLHPTRMGGTIVVR